jgi:hypothetical protein
MIIDNEVNIKMNSKHISKYISLGYLCKVGEFTSIKVEDLPTYSKCEINVKCDDCDTLSKVMYINYTKLIKKFGKYRCFTCGKAKSKNTCIEKYGVDNPTKLKEISNKISDTYKNKSDGEKIKLVENLKKSIFDKYGDWFTKTDEYKSKVKESNIYKYGMDHRSTKTFKNKVKDTIMSKYGVYNVSQIEVSYKKSWFGNKINGVHHSGLLYQGTYELDFLEKYFDSVIIEKIKPIKYELNDNTHYYHPDFYLPKYNLIIEIKSSYTYNYDLEKNLKKKEYSLKNGYNFLFIIDKDYSLFEEFLLV